MTLDILVAEGRRLSRPVWILHPAASNRILAHWYEFGFEDQQRGAHLQLVIDTKEAYPELCFSAPYLGIFSDSSHQRGHLVQLSTLPPGGNPLPGQKVRPLPPLEALFAKGGDTVNQWLEEIQWPGRQRYSEGFPDRDVAEAYIKAWAAEWPPFQNQSAYALLGGWHQPGPDADWFDLADAWLLAWILRGGGPSTEAWFLPTGEFKVIQRTA